MGEWGGRIAGAVLAAAGDVFAAVALADASFADVPRAANPFAAGGGAWRRSSARASATSELDG